jgi:hypothetical protein
VERWHGRVGEDVRRATRDGNGIERAAEALADEARHSPSAAVEGVLALNQAAHETLQWAQAAQTVEALEAAAAMEIAVEEAMQAVRQLLDGGEGASTSPESPAGGPSDVPGAERRG